MQVGMCRDKKSIYLYTADLLRPSNKQLHALFSMREQSNKTKPLAASHRVAQSYQLSASSRGGATESVRCGQPPAAAEERVSGAGAANHQQPQRSERAARQPDAEERARGQPDAEEQTRGAALRCALELGGRRPSPPPPLDLKPGGLSCSSPPPPSRIWSPAAGGAKAAGGWRR
jgi:hypothetical protein